jgi:hypothetical protein
LREGWKSEAIAADDPMARFAAIAQKVLLRNAKAARSLIAVSYEKRAIKARARHAARRARAAAVDVGPAAGGL